MELKKGYKQTEIGVIPEDWDCKLIDDIADVKSGKRLPLGKHLVNHETPYPYIRVADMVMGKVLEEKIKYVPEDTFDAIKNYRIFVDDIFISVAGTLGLVGIIPNNLDGANLTENANKFTNISIDKHFLTYILMSSLIQSKIQSERTLGAQPKLALTRIRNFPIPIPPSQTEQKAIAKALSDTDELISQLNNLINKKRMIKQGAMQTLLNPFDNNGNLKKGWEERYLGDSAILKARIGWQGLTTAEYLYHGDYYLITGTEFKNGYIDWNKCYYVEHERYKQDKNIQIKKNDVLVTKDGTIGKVAFIDNLPKPSTLNSGVFVIRPINNAFHPEFFYYILMSNVFSQFLNQLSAGSTINHLYQKDFIHFKYYIPSDTNEQKSIAKILRDMDAEVSALEAKLAKMKDIKQGMMQKLLTGEIRLINNKEEAPPKHNKHYHEAVVLSVLTKIFGSLEYPLGRFRRMKFTYLLHRFMKESTSDFMKKAAGPYNPKIKYSGAEKIALSKQYVKYHKRGNFEGFVADGNVAEAEEYFYKWYSQEAIEWIKTNFQYKNKDKLELFTTVDMAIEELKENKHEINLTSVKNILSESKAWKSKLKRPIFSDFNLAQTIKECTELWRLE